MEPTTYLCMPGESDAVPLYAMAVVTLVPELRNGLTVWRAVAPEAFVRRYPVVSPSNWFWCAIDHPPAMLDRATWRRLVEEARGVTANGQIRLC